jgi:putative transposase
LEFHNSKEGAVAVKVTTKYPSDTTFEQWEIIEKVLPKAATRGRPPIHRRRIIDAIFYLTRAGCQWRMLPKCFPNWNTVYGIFRQWKLSGVWEKMNAELAKNVRRASGKKPEPSVAIIDSQSIRTAEGGEDRGYDAGKKITGRKRNIAVDTLGMIHAVLVLGADWQDAEAAHFVVKMLKEACGGLRKIFADSAYARNGLVEWVLQACGIKLETVERPKDAQGFVVLRKRWIVERTFAWLMRYRRNGRDYEKTTTSSESMIYISMVQLMSRRLAKCQGK